MCKVIETAITWYQDSTIVATRDIAYNRATVNCTLCSEATALALLHNQGFKDCQDVLFQEPGNCKDYINRFFTNERTGMLAKCVIALQVVHNAK